MAFDAVIIGAGPSGLAAAARLAHFGTGVCLLEAHTRLGGLSSWHHVRGREISSGLHAFTNYSPDGRGGPLGRLLRQLRIKYSDLQLLPQNQSSIRFPSATLRFNNDPDFFRQQVATAFPKAIDGFDRFRRLVNETDEGELTLKQTSARKVMSEYIADPLLTEMLFCPVMFYGNPGGVGDGHDSERSRPDMDWLLFCVVWKCIFESGFAHPAHGMRPLWENLAKRIADDGGVVRTGARVARLRVENGRVVAAVLDTGEEIAGKTFFSSAGGIETDALTGHESEPPRPVGTMTIAEGISILERPPVESGIADTVVFYSFTDEFNFRCSAGLVEDSNGVVCAPGNYQSLDADEGNIVKATQLANYAAWSTLSPEAYAIAKQETGAGMASALGKLGISLAKAKSSEAKYAVFDDLFTPMTLKRYASHAGAALYGSPVKSRTGQTSCANLFLIGTDQGFHGIVGAMLSGVAMVNMHLLAKQN